MKKSIGGKIAVVLSTLALIFVIAMGLNIIALFSIAVAKSTHSFEASTMMSRFVTIYSLSSTRRLFSIVLFRVE